MSNGFLRHVLRDQDLDSKIPPIESVLVMWEFSEVFPNYLPSIPHEREIKFCLDLLTDTNPISISPYWMAPA